jgi:hypothetical protein
MSPKTSSNDMVEREYPARLKLVDRSMSGQTESATSYPNPTTDPVVCRLNLWGALVTRARCIQRRCAPLGRDRRAGCDPVCQ